MKIHVVVASVLVATLAQADTLELRNGKTLEGKVVSMSSEGVRFESKGGEIYFYKDAEIVSIKKGPGAAAPGTAAPSSPAATAGPGGSAILPAGTAMTVKFDDDVTSRMPAGQRFTTTLETNLMSGQTVAVPAGTKVYGVIAASKEQGLVGQSGIAVTLTGFNISGNLVPIKCEVLAGTGERKAKQAARGAAVGAAIGAAAGGGGGAAKGAAIGAAASTLRRKNVGIPAGTLQDFRLTEPVTISR